MTEQKRVCVYPGSFDPVTLGHMDIIKRAAQLFDKVIVAVIRNPHKQGCFNIAERVAMLDVCCKAYDNVVIDSFEGLTTDYVKQAGAQYMIRGLRSAMDFESEQTLAQINRKLAPELDTLFLMCEPEHRIISSSAVREMAQYHCDISEVVPEAVKETIRKHFEN